LVLRVDGSGTFDNLRSTAFGPLAVTLRTGEIATKVTLPATLRLTAPPSVNTANITSLRIDGVQNNQVTSYGMTATPFSWPDGAHVDAAVTLGPSPPGTLLVWRQENGPVGANSQLFDVWVDPSGSPVLAVGENGAALSRIASAWKSEVSGAGSSLVDGVFGLTGGTGWAAGQIPTGVWRRDGATATWSADQTGISTTGKGFWCLTVGQSPGEVWAGDNDGKVWRRSGAETSPGTWISEQALPVGIGVYGIAYANGAVFAVGDAGNVAVRGAGGWIQAKITGNVSGNDWLNAVWAFDQNSAVAVGTSGTLVTFQGGQWNLTAQKIDSANGEMTGVWGLAPSKVWVTSKNGYLLRVDGSSVYKLYQRANVALNAVYGRSESDIYAVGGASNQPSLILHGTP
jgi:hypothetical protein